MVNLATPSPVSRLLVTGASGFLGWHLCRLAQNRWQVQGTYQQHPVALSGVTLHSIDLTQTWAVQDWLQALAPDAVIHAAALSQPNRCEQQPDLSYAVNVEATRTLAQFCGDRQIPFVFTSTDQVFDGEAAPYDETDVPRPIHTYGRHKAEAERIVQAVHPQAVICRLPLLYGPPTPTAACFLQGFIRTLEAGQPLRLFTDEFRTPVYVEDAAQGLLLALAQGSGLLHLGGRERLNRYEFGLLMADCWGLNKSLMMPSQRAEVAMAAARPADVSSDSRRAYGLGYQPRDVASGLMATRGWENFLDELQ
ncbi:MAG: SDR family oxidoreductase [Leptolyngbyaceae cyanobacterium SM2_3_12]|nr:SDR family oxidoreductase [Leptolyngbyaceae cyanobacterium SM2_3_12]